MNKRLLLIFLSSIIAINVYAAPVEPARNKDGSFVTGILEADFNPGEAVAPFPTNLFFPTSPPIDLTVGIPGVDDSDYTNPAAALNSLDGFSTTEKWVTTFSQITGGPLAPVQAGQIDPSTVVPGQSVRVFEVTDTGYPYLGVTGIVRELVAGAEFVAASAEGGVVAIVPLQPLKEVTTYMAVLTNDITDMQGNNATPSQVYNLVKRRTPLVDANGNSTVPLLPDANAAALEPLRQATMSMELSAASAGVNPDDIILSWTVHTQSITPTLKLMRSIAQPADTIVAPTFMNTAAVGGFGLADIYIGVITLPYYGGIPSAENPTAALTEFWRAEPGAYLPPFDQAPFDPTSTNITFANPFPVPTGMQTVPLLVTVPNENSGFTKPEGGWPVVIFIHGFTRNRTDLLAVADAIAQTGRVAVAMDATMHGVVPNVEPDRAPFYVENTPFGPIANERTFDVDYFNAAEGTFIPDGLIDPSGVWFVNVGNLQATRDNFRQTQVDHSVLALSLQHMDIDGDAGPDLDAFDVSMAAQSGGGYLGIALTAVEPIINRAYLNVSGVGLMRSLNEGSFGDSLFRPFLKALAGLEPGTPEFETYLLVAQTLVDSTDGGNWAAEVPAEMPIIHNQVMQDDTVPNQVPGAPLAGSEPMNRLLGLQSYSTTQANPDGLRGVARFLQPAEHGSWLRPTYPAVTAEMQGQTASFLGSLGTLVNVGDPSLLVPAPPPEPPPAEPESAPPVAAKAVQGKSRVQPAKLTRD